MFKRIDHVEIVTDQLDRTVQFYTEVLGFTVKALDRIERSGLGVPINLVYLDLGGTVVELISYEGAAVDPAPQTEHLGYRMIALEVDDMQKTADYLRTKVSTSSGAQGFARPTQGRRSATQRLPHRAQAVVPVSKPVHARQCLPAWDRARRKTRIRYPACAGKSDRGYVASKILHRGPPTSTRSPRVKLWVGANDYMLSFCEY